MTSKNQAKQKTITDGDGGVRDLEDIAIVSIKKRKTCDADTGTRVFGSESERSSSVDLFPDFDASTDQLEGSALPDSCSVSNGVAPIGDFIVPNNSPQARFCSPRSSAAMVRCASVDEFIPPIFKLSDDMLLDIFRYLSIRERIRCERVSQRFLALLPLYVKGITSIKMKDFFDKRRLNDKHNIIYGILRRFGLHLISLDFEDALACGFRELNCGELALVFEHCPKLEMLNLAGIPFTTAKVLSMLAKGAAKLKTLNLSGCLRNAAEKALGDTFATLPELKHLSLAQLPYIKGACLLSIVAPSHLERVDLRECLNLSQSNLEAFLRGCQNLQEFRISSVYDKVPQLLGEYSPNVSVLELSLHWRARYLQRDPPEVNAGLSSMLLKISNLSNLRELSLSHNTLLTDDIFSAICLGCRQLELLDLEQTNLSVLAFIHLSKLSQLKELNISHLKQEDVVCDELLGVIASSHSQSLRKIQLAGSDEISDQGLVHLRSCTKLELVGLRDCSGVTEAGYRGLADHITQTEWNASRKIEVQGPHSAAEDIHFPMDCDIAEENNAASLPAIKKQKRIVADLEGASTEMNSKRQKAAASNGAFSVAWFCAKLNGAHPKFGDVCRLFLNEVEKTKPAAKKNPEKSIIAEFCRIANNGEELTHWLSVAVQQQDGLKAAEVFAVISCVREVIVFALQAASHGRKHSVYKSSAVRMARSLVSCKRTLRAFYRQMLPSENIKYAVTALETLSFACLLDGELCRTLLANLDFSHPCFKEAVTRWPVQPKTGDVASVRFALLSFVISLLRQLDSASLEQFLSRPRSKEFFISIFPHLYFDSAQIVLEFLNTVQTTLVCSTTLSKTVKVRLFGPTILRSLSFLFAWKPVDKITLKSDPADFVDDLLRNITTLLDEQSLNKCAWMSVDSAQIREKACLLLTQLCCNATNGIAFLDRSFGFADIKFATEAEGMDEFNDSVSFVQETNLAENPSDRNNMLTSFMTQLIHSRLFVLPQVRRLISSILQTCLDLYHGLFASLRGQLIPKDTAGWALLADAVADILRVSSDGDMSDLSSCVDRRNLPKDNLNLMPKLLLAMAFPPTVLDALVANGLRHPNPTIMRRSLSIYAVMCRRFDLLLSTLAKTEQASLAARLVQQCAAMLLPAAVLEDAWLRLQQRQSNAVSLRFVDAATKDFLAVARLNASVGLGGPQSASVLNALAESCGASTVADDGSSCLLDFIEWLFGQENDFGVMCRKPRGADSPLKSLLRLVVQRPGVKSCVSPSQSGRAKKILFELIRQAEFLKSFESEVDVFLERITDLDLAEDLFCLALCNPHPFYDQLPVCANDAFTTERSNHGASQTVHETVDMHETDFSILSPILLHLRSNDKYASDAAVLSQISDFFADVVCTQTALGRASFRNWLSKSAPPHVQPLRDVDAFFDSAERNMSLAQFTRECESCLSRTKKCFIQGSLKPAAAAVFCAEAVNFIERLCVADRDVPNASSKDTAGERILIVVNRLLKPFLGAVLSSDSPAAITSACAVQLVKQRFLRAEFLSSVDSRRNYLITSTFVELTSQCAAFIDRQESASLLSCFAGKFKVWQANRETTLSDTEVCVVTAMTQLMVVLLDRADERNSNKLRIELLFALLRNDVVRPSNSDAFWSGLAHLTMAADSNADLLCALVENSELVLRSMLSSIFSPNAAPICTKFWLTLAERFPIAFGQMDIARKSTDSLLIAYVESAKSDAFFNELVCVLFKLNGAMQHSLVAWCTCNAKLIKNPSQQRQFLELSANALLACDDDLQLRGRLERLFLRMFSASNCERIQRFEDSDDACECSTLLPFCWQSFDENDLLQMSATIHTVLLNLTAKWLADAHVCSVLEVCVERVLTAHENGGSTLVRVRELLMKALRTVIAFCSKSDRCDEDNRTLRASVVANVLLQRNRVARLYRCFLTSESLADLESLALLCELTKLICTSDDSLSMLDQVLPICQKLIALLLETDVVVDRLTSPEANDDAVALRQKILTLLDVAVAYAASVAGSACQNTCVFKDSYVPILLSAYGGTLALADQTILRILQTAELELGANFSPFHPLLWRNAARQHYANVKLLGPSLAGKPTCDDVLDLIDAQRMLKTCLMFPLSLKRAVVDATDASNHSQDLLYDPRFMLPLFAHMLTFGDTLNCHRLIQTNCVGLAFVALSSRDAHLRGLAYRVLSLFVKRLKADEKFRGGRGPIVHLFSALRQSVETPNARVPFVVALFLARSLTLLLSPDEYMYKLITQFLLLKPTLDMANVPEFYKLFVSCSHTRFAEERRWMLQLLRDGLREAKDYRVYANRHSFEFLLNHYTSAFVSVEEQRLILSILCCACELESAVIDLCRSANIVGWIVAQLQAFSSFTSESAGRSSDSEASLESASLSFAPLPKNAASSAFLMGHLLAILCKTVASKASAVESFKSLIAADAIPVFFSANLQTALGLVLQTLSFVIASPSFSLASVIGDEFSRTPSAERSVFSATAIMRSVISLCYFAFSALCSGDIRKTRTCCSDDDGVLVHISKLTDWLFSMDPPAGFCSDLAIISHSKRLVASGIHLIEQQLQSVKDAPDSQFSALIIMQTFNMCLTVSSSLALCRTDDVLVEQGESLRSSLRRLSDLFAAFSVRIASSTNSAIPSEVRKEFQTRLLLTLNDGDRH